MELEPKFEIISVAQRGPESSFADLGELAERIKKEHSNVAIALQQGFMHASAAGELLIQAKANAGHGKWLSWLQEKCEISVRTASLYMRLSKNRGRIEDQIGDAVADLTLRGAMKLLSPPRQSDPQTAEGNAGTGAASAADPLAIKDNRKALKMKRRRCALNADGPSIPSIGSPSSADPAPSNSAEPPALRRTDGEGNYEAFKSRWAKYCDADFAALPAEMRKRFVTEVLSMSVPSGDISCPVSPPSPPFSVQYASMMRG
jgi:DUF3102 family protein